MSLSILLFFVSSVFAASSVPLMLEEAAAAAAAEDGRSLCPPALCGDVNISFPFGIVPDHATTRNCGEIGFQVVCANNTPYLGHNQEYISLQILNISYDSTSLVVVDVRKLEMFDTSGHRGCHISHTNSSSKLGQPFTISPANQNLIFYNCTMEPPPPARGRLVETVCGNNTFVRVAEITDESGEYGSDFLEGCDATVVPVIGVYGNANASNYKELVSDGFLLTWNQLPALPPLPQLPERRHGHKHKHKHKLILVGRRKSPEEHSASTSS